MSAPFRKTIQGKEYFESDTTITNEKLIPLISLQSRWKGSTFNEIYYIISTGELLCFTREKTIFKNEENIHYLRPICGIYYDDFVHEFIWDKKAIVFQSDIERIEKERPDFLCQKVFDNIEKDDDENLNSVPSSTENTDYQSVQKQTGVQEALHARISELEAALADSKAENDKLRADNEELKNSTKAGGESEEWLDLYPICKTIRGLHLAGKSRDEIRLALLDKGYSNAQTAFLTQEDTNIRTDNAQKQVMKRVKRKMGGT